ncbi:MAG TPA: RNA methyltransferase [Bacteroidales bacterium]|nr:RNA methyltransferase [Bacteroidales bacterium]HPS63386.1 RNA methyltransferase [Bacteroidales bacterium]
MLTHAQIKHLAALKNKKYRTELGRFTAEGHKLVMELVNSRFHVEAVYATPAWQTENDSLIQTFPVPLHTILPHQMERVTQLSTPGPILAEVCIPEPGEEPVYSHGLVLALDGIRDPGNLGTIIRIADWFGIREIACSGDCVEAWNPKVIQATMGSIVRVAVHSCDLPRFLASAALAHPPRPVYGALLDGDSLYTTRLEPEGIIVIGNESRGISPETARFVNRRITIPAYGGAGDDRAESLNASVAAAVICAEFRRCRQVSE